MLVLSLLFLVAVIAAPQRPPPGVSGTIDLQSYTKISHDTYYLSRKRHPNKPDTFVHGYAFLNLHRNTRAKLPSANLIHRDKHVHFKRNLTTHESPRSNVHAKKIYAELPSCTGPIAEGTSWKTSRGFYLHTKNRNGLTTAFIVEAIQRANDAWHCGTNEHEMLIEGPLLAVVDASSGQAINLNEPDGVNEIGFAAISGHPGTVAVTIVWGIFDGPVADRAIIEYDMLFDGTNYAWGDGSVDRSVMDLQAIATHETGHSYGLDDIYDTSCADVTMYGTSSEGETAKRTLEPRDLQGLSLLYGPLAP